MNGHRQHEPRPKEAEMYLQFLNEDTDSFEPINEDLASRIERLLEEVRKRLRELANLLDLQMKEERNKKSNKKGNIL